MRNRNIAEYQKPCYFSFLLLLYFVLFLYLVTPSIWEYQKIVMVVVVVEWSPLKIQKSYKWHFSVMENTIKFQ